jgi:hypothetical protein
MANAAQSLSSNLPIEKMVALASEWPPLTSNRGSKMAIQGNDWKDMNLSVGQKDNI